MAQNTGSLKKISFLAHSLGGLFSRYAIAVLYSSDNLQKDMHDDYVNGKSQSGSSLKPGSIGGLEPINFITLATPHLGVRGNKQVNELSLIHLKELFVISLLIVFIM